MIQDLTRLESGNETSLNESFNLQSAIDEATRAYRNEAGRRQIDFKLEISDAPTMVIGDIKKIKTVVSNLTANSCKRILCQIDCWISITFRSKIYYPGLNHRSLPYLRGTRRPPGS